jgi:putative spermidine/putrescine transport system ATP-binding protein
LWDLPRPTRFVTGASVVVTCRPEEVSLFPDAGPGRLAARLIVSIPLGPHVIHDLELTDGTGIRCAQLRAQAPDNLHLGDRVFVAIDPERCHVFAPDATGGDPHASS